MRLFCDRRRAGAANPPSLDAPAPSLYTSRPLTKIVRTFSAGSRPAIEHFEAKPMSRRCDLTGKKALIGHKVSHSNRKTKRRFMPNLQNVTLMSDTLGRRVHARVSTNALKTVDHRGGLDGFLLKANDKELAPKMLELKRAIIKKKAATA